MSADNAVRRANLPQGATIPPDRAGGARRLSFVRFLQIDALPVEGMHFNHTVLAAEGVTDA